MSCDLTCGCATNNMEYCTPQNPFPHSSSEPYFSDILSSSVTTHISPFYKETPYFNFLAFPIKAQNLMAINSKLISYFCNNLLYALISVILIVVLGSSYPEYTKKMKLFLS